VIARPRLLPLLIGSAVVAVAPCAGAQTLEDRLRSQLVTVTAQLHELQAAQASSGASAAQLAAVQKERDDYKARLARSESQLAAARKAARAAPPKPTAEDQHQADTRDQAAAKASAQVQAKLTAAEADLGRLTQERDQLRSERDRAASTLAADQAGLAACRVKNAQAIQVAEDVMRAYHRISVGDVLARREPLTGLARVHFEQLEQDYGDHLYDSRLDIQPRKAASPAGPAVDTRK
jgi:hypothetical protein